MDGAADRLHLLLARPHGRSAMRHHTILVAGVPVGQGNMKAYSVGGKSRVTHKNGTQLDTWRRTITDAVHRQLGEEIELMTGPLW
ncbi:MAG TPA: hypothetical protein VJT72_18660, partial [Pseudonocardiaceae bacterium]|nr:hypothetical protein [Pseudonocardiaceae bacterium]